MMDKHHLQVGSGWSLRAGAGGPASAERGSKSAPSPHPRTPSPEPRARSDPSKSKNELASLPTGFLPAPLFRSLQGLSLHFRGDSRGYEEGAWQHFFFFFFFRRASYQCDKGPKEAMPPAPVALSPTATGCVNPAKSPAAARQFAVSGQRFAKQTAPSCISPSCSLEFYCSRAPLEQGPRPGPPRQPLSEAKRLMVSSKLPAFQGFIWRRKRVLQVWHRTPPAFPKGLKRWKFFVREGKNKEERRSPKRNTLDCRLPSLQV